MNSEEGRALHPRLLGRVTHGFMLATLWQWGRGEAVFVRGGGRSGWLPQAGWRQILLGNNGTGNPKENASGGIERRWIPVEGCLDRKPLRVVRGQQP